MTFKQRIHDIVFRSDLKATRLSLAIGAICIGLGFAWPTPVFPTALQIASGSGRHTYVIMATIAPEWLWSLLFLVQGSIALYAMLSTRRSSCLMWCDAGLGVLLWTVAIGSCYLAYWQGFDRIWEYRPPAIMGGEVAAVFAQWWVFVRYHCSSNVQDRRQHERRS